MTRTSRFCIAISRLKAGHAGFTCAFTDSPEIIRCAASVIPLSISRDLSRTFGPVVDRGSAMPPKVSAPVPVRVLGPPGRHGKFARSPLPEEPGDARYDGGGQHPSEDDME